MNPQAAAKGEDGDSRKKWHEEQRMHLLLHVFRTLHIT